MSNCRCGRVSEAQSLRCQCFLYQLCRELHLQLQRRIRRKPLRRSEYLKSVFIFVCMKYRCFSNQFERNWDTEQKSYERDNNKVAGIIIYKLTSILKDAILHLEVWRGLWYTVLNSSETGFFKVLALPDKKGSMFAYIVCRWRWMCFVFASKENTLYLRG